MIIFKKASYSDTEKSWIDCCEIESFVYMITNFTFDDFNIIHVDDVIYVGKTHNLQARLAGHQKRKAGYSSISIRFDTREEAYYAEKVLINHFQPKENKEKYNGYHNDHYAEILISKVWKEFVEYKTDAPTTKKAKAK